MSETELKSLAREVEARLSVAAEEERRVQLDALGAVRRLDPELAARLEAFFGSEEKAAAWLCRRERALEARPLTLLGEGRRDIVLKTLSAIERGDVV